MLGTDTKPLVESRWPVLWGRFSEVFLAASDFRGDLEIICRPQAIADVVRFLKEDSAHEFKLMVDLFAMDYLKFKPVTPERYAVIYILYSLRHRTHIRLKVYLPEDNPRVASLTDIYKAANWFEREAWDLFGIEFEGHPNLIRILCHKDFKGHPLRKDYPADGYQRLRVPASSQEF